MIKVKICGITNIEDALAAAEFGADMLGFIFAPSPRQIKTGTVIDIIQKLPPAIEKVGVFMNHAIDFIAETMESCQLNMAQLHGNESPEFCNSLPFKVVKVFSPETLTDIVPLQQYNVDFIMLDKQKGAAANTEEIWPLAREIAYSHQLFLAGGLIPENVCEAIRMVRPYAVDVASGIERVPGIKDHPKMKSFIHNCKNLI